MQLGEFWIAGASLYGWHGEQHAGFILPPDA